MNLPLRCGAVKIRPEFGPSLSFCTVTHWPNDDRRCRYMKRPAKDGVAVTFAKRRVALVRSSVIFGRTWTVTVWLAAVFHLAVYVVSIVGPVEYVNAPLVPVMSVAIC